MELARAPRANSGPPIRPARDDVACARDRRHSFELDALPPVEVDELSDNRSCDGFTIHQTQSSGPEPGIHLPALLYQPAESDRARSLYLHGDGMAGSTEAGWPARSELVRRRSFTVLAVDVRGVW